MPGSSFTIVTLTPTRECIDLDDLLVTPNAVVRAGAGHGDVVAATRARPGVIKAQVGELVDPKADLTYGYSPYNSMAGNPITFNDPDGDVLPLLAIVGIAAAIGATGNVAAQWAAGDLEGGLRGGWNGIGNVAEAWFTGAAGGALVGLGIGAGLTVPAIATGLKVVGGLAATAQAASTLRGVGEGVFTGDWGAFRNSVELPLGLFYTDKERPIFNQVFQLGSRFTWELPQTALGYSYSHARNAFGQVDRVDLYRGATFTQRWDNPDGFGGISLGSFINTSSRRPDPGLRN